MNGAIPNGDLVVAASSGKFKTIDYGQSLKKIEQYEGINEKEEGLCYEKSSKRICALQSVPLFDTDNGGWG